MKSVTTLTEQLREGGRGGPRTAVLWDPSMTAYSFGDYHPMHPSRLDATARLAKDLGLFDLPGVVVEKPEVAEDSVLLGVHTRPYVEAVKAFSEDPAVRLEGNGLDGEDTPGFAGVHEAAGRLAGGSRQAAAAIAEGRVQHAVNFGGGMHHAHSDHASGFCVYNDCAVGITYLLEHGFERIAYIDVDAHHGDGTQSIFWDDPRVMTISLHETGMSLFPGTGFSSETGGAGGAEGTAVNVALPTAAGDAAWLRAFHAVVPPLVRAFQPQIIVSQHGCDSHFRDELTHLRISVDAHREVASAIADLAAEVCEDRWLATGGGGYNVLDVVPRSWAHLIGVAAGSPVRLSDPTPPSWREHIREKYGIEAPERMGDGSDLWWRPWEVGYDPEDELDRAVISTRREVFPLWGLDPWFD
jgi:acetoin utilization protein AcuC